jgi:hypothetical protein
MDQPPIPLAVLIVEDMESDTQLIVRLLKKAGYDLSYEQVETWEQMRDALEKQDWDIVISPRSHCFVKLGATSLSLLCPAPSARKPPCR